MKINDSEEFRNTISTVDEKGKRVWIYPKKPFGAYYNARTILSYFFVFFLFAAPFIHVNGNPLMMFNVLERKFVIFGVVFLPQDFYLFVIAMLSLFVFVILFTVAFGRIFCGWICPQTIFMEMVFRKIEYWIEGDAQQQKKLNQQNWNREKWIKKSTKQIIFFCISFIIANIFMAYLVGRESWYEIVSQPPTQNLGGFIALIFFSGAFYGVFASLREQVCTTICPYGRLQGVLLDNDSIVIAYDHIRGEKRGKLEKNATAEERKFGDCIDCDLCVQVCPTGIDIRNGTQLECVNCTACIDACDYVMNKINRPTGLIKYASYNNIVNQKPFKITLKIAAYSAVLALMLGVFSFALIFRNSLEIVILRTPGTLYQETTNEGIVNLYSIQIINKTNLPIVFDLKLESPNEGEIKLIKNNNKIEKHEIYDSAMLIEIPKNKLNKRKNTLKIGVYHKGKKIEETKTQFIAPIKILND